MTTLRRKTITLLGITLTGLVLISFLSFQVIVSNSFDQLERGEMKENLQNARNSLFWDLMELEMKTADWSVWDETYYFVRKENDKYIDKYLMDDTFLNQRVGFALFYDSSGTLIYSKGMDLPNKTMMPVPQFIIDHLDSNKYLLQHDDRDSRKTGLLDIGPIPIMLTSQPIVKVDKNIPIGGVVLMGRFMDKAEQDLLSERSKLAITMPCQKQKDGLKSTDLLLTTGEEMYLDDMNTSTISGIIFCSDIYGDPDVALQVSSARPIYHLGRITMTYLLLVLMIIPFIFGYVTLYMLDISFLSRMKDLNADIKSIGESQDLSQRVYEAGDDEVSDLGSSINLLLSSLEESRLLVLKKDASLKAIMQAMPDMVFHIRKDGTIFRYKLSTDGCIYESPDRLNDLTIDDVLPADIATMELAVIENVLRTGNMETLHYQLPVKGEIRDYEARIVMSGHEEVMSVVKDITDIKKVEEAHKKDLLLREVHHRVKNNLQVISSMLNIQSRKFKDKEVVDAFRDSQHRTRSMALAHEKLCMSQNMEKVDMEDYIQTVVESLINSYGYSPRDIHITLNISNVIFGVDTSIPIGLIVNELVSNSLRHAFHGGPGKISIEIYAEDDHFIMNVSDNGVGFAEGIDFRDTNSLGMQLVNSLVEQIGGHIELHDKNGTLFRIKFKELSYVKRGY